MMDSMLSFTPPIVKRLLSWRVENSIDEEKWAEKAIRSLIKKLKKSGRLEDLELVLINKDPCSKCITIPRSLDGRLQVSHRKGLPHVIYCRLWRWPDLKSHHEIKPFEKCFYAFHYKKDEVCVNPYHYVRIENSSSTPILTNLSSIYPVAPNLFSGFLSLPSEYIAQNDLIQHNYTKQDFDRLVNMERNSFSCAEDVMMYEKTLHSKLDGECMRLISNINSNNNNIGICGNSSNPGLENFTMSNLSVQNSNSNNNNNNVMTQNISCFPNNCSVANNENGLMNASMANFSSTKGNFFSTFVPQNPAGEDIECKEVDRMSRLISACRNHPSNGNGLQNLTAAAISGKLMSESVQKINAGPMEGPQSNLIISQNSENFGTSGSYSINLQQSTDPMEIVKNMHESFIPKISSCQMLPYWCTVNYYEFDKKIGESFHSAAPVLTIDGYASCVDDKGRFSLGILNNISRRPESERCRKQIGPGLRITHTANDEVIVECCALCSVFICSLNYNIRNKLDHRHVVKLKCGESMMIFSYRDFSQWLLAAANKGYEEVYNLMRTCIINFSFVKGWGSHYHRQTISSTPTWIELQLAGPLTWIDRVLQQLVSPMNRCSSMT